MGSHTSKHRSRRDYSSPQQWSVTRTTSPTTTLSRHRNAMLSNFAVIAVIFNPISYKSRYNHYQRFEAHMLNSGIKLITVECIFESAPRYGLRRQHFEVTNTGDRNHIQIVASSIMWMKENLINVAVQNLPQNIEYIAWIDADVEFDHLDWPHLAIAELERYPIVQLFELCFFLGPGGKREILRRDYSFGYSIKHNKPIDPKRYNEWYAHPGYAWAMRRSAFNSFGGLLDFCIVGSGDLHFAFALLNRINETIRPGLHEDYKKLATIWGDRVAQVAQNGANVGYVPINLWHYWHGERTDRSYVDRWSILEKYQFSPINDLEKNYDNGLIRLVDKNHFDRPEMAARIEALENDIVAYFKSRNEDNSERSVQNKRPPPKSKPFVATRTQAHRRGPNRSTPFSTNTWGGNRRPPLWTSGPSGTHVDDCNPFHQCNCPGHIHHCHDEHCPCSIHHSNDEICPEPSTTHHHHDQHLHDNQHNHHDQYPHDNHHYHHDYHHDNHDNHHDTDHSWGGHHDGWNTTDYGNNGFGSTDYGGAGSFY